MRYYVQHGAGLGRLVLGALETDLGPVHVVFRDDSSVVFDSPAASSEVAALPYTKNAFKVLASVPRGGLPRSVDQLVRQMRNRKLLAGQQRGTPFRTMANVDGELVSLQPPVRAQLERVIAEQTGGRLNARGGGNSVEYWIVGRRDLDQFLLCLRLTTGTKKASPRGALATDLATLLVKASGPRPDDVFLDPFAGSGALVTARLNWPLRKAILSDIKTAELPRRITASRQVAILREDALQLPSVRDESVTALVTDPPWSEYEQVETPYEDFADAMLASFDRVLHPQRGRLVVLLARRLTGVVTKAWERSLLELPDSHEILVNGHPATVLVGGRPRLR